MFHLAVQDMWVERKSAGALGNPTPMVFYMTDKARLENRLERNLNQNVAEVERYLKSPGVILSYARYGSTGFLSYYLTFSGCSGGGALFYVSLVLTRLQYA